MLAPPCIDKGASQAPLAVSAPSLKSLLRIGPVFPILRECLESSFPHFDICNGLGLPHTYPLQGQLLHAQRVLLLISGWLLLEYNSIATHSELIGIAWLVDHQTRGTLIFNFDAPLFGLILVRGPPQRLREVDVVHGRWGVMPVE